MIVAIITRMGVMRTRALTSQIRAMNGYTDVFTTTTVTFAYAKSIDSVFDTFL